MSTVIKLKDGKHFIFMKGASEYMINISDKYRNLETGEVVEMNYELK